MKRRLNNFLTHDATTKFGDYLLFQEYSPTDFNGQHHTYSVSKPKLVVFIGAYMADMALSFDYLPWVNYNHRHRITNEHVTNYRTNIESGGVESHHEWSDYIDILGHWDHRPTWKEIVAAYRKQNIDGLISSDGINWEI